MSEDGGHTDDDEEDAEEEAKIRRELEELLDADEAPDGDDDREARLQAHALWEAAEDRKDMNKLVRACAPERAPSQNGSLLTTSCLYQSFRYWGSARFACPAGHWFSFSLQQNKPLKARRQPMLLCRCVAGRRPSASSDLMLKLARPSASAQDQERLQADWQPRGSWGRRRRRADAAAQAAQRGGRGGGRGCRRGDCPQSVQCADTPPRLLCPRSWAPGTDVTDSRKPALECSTPSVSLPGPVY